MTINLIDVYQREPLPQPATSTVNLTLYVTQTHASSMVNTNCYTFFPIVSFHSHSTHPMATAKGRLRT